MANDTIITVVGNLTADPELRFTQSGVAVASFTIASTPRTFNRQSNQWEDGEALFLRCSLWRDAAENAAESLEKGTRVVAQGRLKQRSFTDREGNNRTSIELDVDEIGPSLRYATAKANKVQRGGGGGFNGGGQRGGQGNQGGGFGGPQGGQGGGFSGGGQGGFGGNQGGGADQDPWAGGNQGGYDDPPF
ncbi:single-stranded DNA-binding protein [Brachybacterium sp. MASK1Z-5]|uniref:Single-stranded DNA-binding protein n=1 Tax=Brachybacterium halotolerans TaxID=2795215 RepID=A0ABS1B9M1_9MICO|nr:single-stranded DNA-binding protein [Brachybacterium halotolerans]MBK0331356.1 single-stranded DNA-binding protein [Brachybacterium halotolerans]